MAGEIGTSARPCSSRAAQKQNTQRQVSPVQHMEDHTERLSSEVSRPFGAVTTIETVLRALHRRHHLRQCSDTSTDSGVSPFESRAADPIWKRLAHSEQGLIFSAP